MAAEVTICHDLESRVRELEGKEFVVTPFGLMVQDFVRFPVLVGHEDYAFDMSGREVSRAIANGVHVTAASVSGGKHNRCFITGDPSITFPVLEGDAVFGINRAIFSSTVTHAFLFDPNGEALPLLRRHAPKGLPIGVIHVMSDERVVREWAQWAMVGIYRFPSGERGCLGEIVRGIRTELYGPDPAASAVHYAKAVCACPDIVLAAADRSFSAPRPGAIPMGGRFIHPEHVSHVELLHTVCHVVMRNGGRVRFFKDTMIPLPGADPIDNEMLAMERMADEER